MRGPCPLKLSVWREPFACAGAKGNRSEIGFQHDAFRRISGDGVTFEDNNAKCKTCNAKRKLIKPLISHFSLHVLRFALAVLSSFSPACREKEDAR
jgi:hypothetical protein